MSITTKDEELTLDKLLKFLSGEESINGRWFGETYDGEPAFWWRPQLKRLIKQYGLEQREHMKQIIKNSNTYTFEDGTRVYSEKSMKIDHEPLQSITDEFDNFIINLLNFKQKEREFDIVYINKSHPKIWCNAYQMEQLVSSYKNMLPFTELSTLKQQLKPESEK